MDLNELPSEFDYDFLGDLEANPSYCTQAVEVSGQGAVRDIVQGPDQQLLPALGNVEAAVGNYDIAENHEDVQTIADNTQGFTWEQSKVIFVCNKEGRGRKAKEGNLGAESDDSNYEGGGSDPENNSEEYGNEDDQKSKRKKNKRLKKGMNAEAKRKNKCSICKSTNHNAARCTEKVAEKLTKSGGAAA
ncbi:hypothetical protein C2845_PM15G06430 [Panicum miliaceum]|uniref:Uncharacterized protein n=1 Tax=Panicum miliaceum TaxID=4540 RepID=A0A3L6Q7B1_PANMI|nr:hypothetical protein C2845_PM15G06430 [Panicum miliaceum]